MAGKMIAMTGFGAGAGKAFEAGEYVKDLTDDQMRQLEALGKILPESHPYAYRVKMRYDKLKPASKPKPKPRVKKTGIPGV